MDDSPCQSEEHEIGEGFEALERWVAAHVSDVNAREDVTQETALRAITYWSSRQAGTPLTPWLFSIATNVRHAQATRQWNAGIPMPNESLPDLSVPDHGDLLADLELSAPVLAGLAALSEPQRQVLILRARGYTAGQVAASTGRSEGAVNVAYSRARRIFVKAFTAAKTGGHVIVAWAANRLRRTVLSSASHLSRASAEPALHHGLHLVRALVHS